MTAERFYREKIAPRVHIGCGGVVLWDLSGGFCTRCHAENLEPDDAERGQEPLGPEEVPSDR